MFAADSRPRDAGGRVEPLYGKVYPYMFDILISASAYALIIVVGAVCAHTGFIKPETKNVFSRLLFNITLPCTVVYSFVGFQFDASLLLISLVSFAATVVGFGGAMLFTRHRKPEDRMIPTLMGFGYNIGCFALPFISSVVGPTGVVLACMFDLGNTILVSGGAYAIVRTFILKKRTGGVVGSLIRTTLQSPALDCYLVLIALSLVGISVPEQLGTLIHPMSEANSFLAMFMIGLVFEWRIDKRHLLEVCKVLGWRLIVALAFCALVYFAIPMAPDLRNVTILCLLAPIMSVGLVYIIWVDGDTQTAGFAISLSVVIALILMTAASVLLM